MKKFVLIENQLTKLTPFKHYHDLINLKINKDNIGGGLGFDNISDFDQLIKLFRHNEYNAPYYLELTDTSCTINSWNNESVEVPVHDLLEKCHETNTNRHWVLCCWPDSSKQNSLNDLIYVYRNSCDDTLRDVFTNNVINNGSNVISNTFFILYGEWPEVPLFHVMLNDNLVYWPIQTIDNDNIFVDTVSYHDGKFAEYVFKPRTHGCFEHENLLITPRDKFKIDFYGRSRFYLKNNNDFPFDKLKLKIKTNLKYSKIDTGVYEFDMNGSNTGYLYARINAGYGAEVEASTRMRLAYTVHKS